MITNWILNDNKKKKKRCCKCSYHRKFNLSLTKNLTTIKYFSMEYITDNNQQTIEAATYYDERIHLIIPFFKD